MTKKFTRAQLIEVLTAVSRVTLTHAQDCTSTLNGECFCALGGRHELRNKVRDALKVENNQLCEQIRAMEEEEAAYATYNKVCETSRQNRAPSDSPDVALAHRDLINARLRLNRVRAGIR